MAGQKGVKSLDEYMESKHTMIVYYGVLYGILWYDWVSTIPQEYRKIWKAKHSAAKYFYLANRYAPLATSVFVLAGFGLEWTVEKCNRYLLGWQAALPTIAAAAGGALLLLRCHAIWSKSRTVLGVLLVCYAGRMAGLIYFASMHVITLRRPAELLYGPCIPKDSNVPIVAYCWIPLAYEIVVCGLFLYRAYQMRKEFPQSGISQLLVTVTNHGCIYLIAIVAVNVVHIIFMKIRRRIGLDSFAEYGGSYICNVFESILAARLVLATKSADDETRRNPFSQPQTTSWTTKTTGSRKGLVVPMDIVVSVDALTRHDQDDVELEKGRQLEKEKDEE